MTLRRVKVHETDKIGDPEVLRGRDPAIMWPLLRSLHSQGGLLTWLVPHYRTIGIPSFADPDVQWLTMVDDLDPIIAGPSSFDSETLHWWVERAEVLVVDAAMPHPKKFVFPAGMLEQGALVLVVQTPEERREGWHQFIREVRDATIPALVIDIMDSTIPGANRCRLRYGELGTEFAADAPYIPARMSDGLGLSGGFADV